MKNINRPEFDVNKIASLITENPDEFTYDWHHEDKIDRNDDENLEEEPDVATEPSKGSSPWSLFDYAKEVLKDRWPAAERTIMKDPSIAYLYTKYVINRTEDGRGAQNYEGQPAKAYIRWEEAEPSIMQDARAAADYAINILNRRWYQAERLILQNKGAKEDYARRIAKMSVSQLRAEVAQNIQSMQSQDDEDLSRTEEE